MGNRERTLWKKLLGITMKSFTNPEENYTLFLDENGWTCDCMDFKIRGGSYQIFFQDPDEPLRVDKPLIEIQGCKHIAQHLADIGMQNVLRVDRFGFKCHINPKGNP